ncbi:MAG: GGDEF domain-containing protein [Thermoanaerobaculia bacterium]
MSSGSSSRISGFRRRADSDSRTESLELQAILDDPDTLGDGSDALAGAADEHEPSEASIIVIAHPEGKRLGTRFRLKSGERLVLGRDPDADISVPEVLSVSRRHAQLLFAGGSVKLRDMGSTNGTFLNGQVVREPTEVRSGDRFQVASVHFKFLLEEDVENAYYQAISDLVTRDGLTDVFNQRKFQEEAEREWVRALRHDRPLAMILVDLDDFKSINDQNGHLCGDFVLKRVAGTIQGCLEPDQLLARMGGDEFVVLCPEATEAEAYEVAQAICRQIESLDFTYCEVSVPVACSLGVAGRRPSMRKHPELYEAADRALYASKRAGRNRVSCLAELEARENSASS